ncbi:MAG: type I 3-dehydroquinate dehydratase [bacterium]|jgi:3-dehydroquinate dehydratase/shikimate dehydrogenase
MAIVVSLLEDSLEALAASARRQEPLADLIELRLDAIRGVSEDALRDVIGSISRPVIVTLHGPEAFGAFSGSTAERCEILHMAARAGASFVDIDWQLSLELGEVAGKCHRIVSRHETQGTPQNLTELLGEVEAVVYEGDLIKFVTQAQTCEDGLRVLRLLRERGGGLVAFASGDAGSFTRILAPIFGSPFTYAAPAVHSAKEPSRPTAPGQLRLGDMLALAPPGGLGPETAVFGVVGNPARHSWSPRLFGMALKGARLDALYLAFEPEDFETFLDLADDENFRGFSVTAPFKAAAMARAAHSEATCESVGAANTLVRNGKGWSAFNTDVEGVRETLRRGFLAHAQRGLEPETAASARILVVGAGGAARAAARATSELGASLLCAARRDEAAQDLARDFGGQALAWDSLADAEYDGLVHCTPAGSLAQPGVLPFDSGALRPRTVVLDAVYRPLKTPLLAAAMQKGCTAIPGGEWFVRQALRQFEHFTSQAPNEELMRATFAHAFEKGAAEESEAQG